MFPFTASLISHFVVFLCWGFLSIRLSFLSRRENWEMCFSLVAVSSLFFFSQMKSNAVSWNPMRPSRFVAASEDQNLYTFDMRKLSAPLIIHRDFVNAVYVHHPVELVVRGELKAFISDPFIPHEILLLLLYIHTYFRISMYISSERDWTLLSPRV